MNKIAKKLAVKKETVRSLTEGDIAGVHGGRIKLPTNTCACPPAPTDTCSGNLCGPTFGCVGPSQGGC